MAALRRLSAGAVITILNIGLCHGLAEFVQFPGFDAKLDPNATTQTVKPTTEFFFYTPPVDVPLTTKGFDIDNMLKHLNSSKETSNSSTLRPLDLATTVFCPEEERPTNIGPYEVPTQRDLVISMKTRLLKMFRKYNKKALFLLKDIKEATRATSEVEFKCPTDRRHAYRTCVQHVERQCKQITKTMVTSLEYQRHDVTALTEGSICNMTAMKIDPVELIKTVAMEEASLEFALPGFLRLLSACSYYCNTSNADNEPRIKPTRHMTDQELVVKHFLTRKNYVQLIKVTP